MKFKFSIVFLFSEIIETDLQFCIKSDTKNSRKMYGDGESCPVFCPNHYRPVCGASKIRDYVYRTFTNGCHLDLLNCRGDDEVSGNPFLDTYTRNANVSTRNVR